MFGKIVKVTIILLVLTINVLYIIGSMQKVLGNNFPINFPKRISEEFQKICDFIDKILVHSYVIPLYKTATLFLIKENSLIFNDISPEKKAIYDLTIPKSLSLSFHLNENITRKIESLTNKTYSIFGAPLDRISDNFLLYKICSDLEETNTSDSNETHFKRSYHCMKEITNNTNIYDESIQKLFNQTLHKEGIISNHSLSTEDMIEQLIQIYRSNSPLRQSLTQLSNRIYIKLKNIHFVTKFKYLPVILSILVPPFAFTLLILIIIPKILSILKTILI